MTKPPLRPGTIGWIDLTVPDADVVRDFYVAVAGWTADGLSMGEYDDHVMRTPDGDAVTGICHARGGNAGLPAQWLMYITVPDLDVALAAATARGGACISDIRTHGGARYAAIRDPAGAVCALFEPAP
jgi:uncharacterized protein